jgi:NADH-quinone oxidoreductase subunit L
MNFLSHNLIVLGIFLPFLGFIFNGLIGKRLKNEKVIGLIGSSTVGISFIIMIMTAISKMTSPNPTIIKLWDWLSVGKASINFSYQIDSLSLIFGLIITGVGFFIHLYSIGYMHGDRSFYRFFAYMNLFIFMMLNLVFSSNFILTFLGWEGVGLSSYLLIGFWYDKKFDGVRINNTSGAANKAFIVNRIGDFGFLVAIFFIFMNFHTFEYAELSDTVFQNRGMYADSLLITTITIMMFLACTGKSAQLPLAVWLPDAMAGPTSVSALIHAATMVTSGIFLIARNSVLFALSPLTSEIILIVGIATALYGATVALVQTDIKKVLAYSTVSQLGFMFAAIGVGAYTVAVFHVMTHAFFKGLLFLGSGSVIHSMHEEQDIMKMGNLRKYMPVTDKTFLIGTLAIAGIPFFSGFFSKDEIMWNVFSNGSPVAWILLLIAAVFTSFYMFRLYFLTFMGKERFSVSKVHPHESPKTMTTALIVLAIASAIGGFIGVPYVLGAFISDHPNILENTLKYVFQDANSILGYGAHEIHLIEYILMLITVIAASYAIYLAYKKYANYSGSKTNKQSVVYKLLWNKYYLDEIYYALIIDPLFRFSEKFIYRVVDKKIIDGIMHGFSKITVELGNGLKRTQTGIIQNYAMVMLVSIIIIVAYLIY